MRKRRPPRYLHHKSRYLGFARIDGRQVYSRGARLSAESIAAYEVRLNQWRQTTDRNVYPLTVADLCVAYADHAETSYQQHGQSTRLAQPTSLSGL